MANGERIQIAAVQMTSKLGERTANLQHAGEMLAPLAGEVDIACLPEAFTTGYDLDTMGESIFDMAESVPGETTARLGALAHRLQMGLVVGLVEREPDVTGVIYNTVVLLNRAGELVGRYRKSHLYPAEHAVFRAGGALPVFDLGGVLAGVAVCFEQAFPQVFTTLAWRGAQIVFSPSAVPEGYMYLQTLRTRARAQDNQLFVVMTNHTGVEGGITYGGRSLIADPLGDTIAQASADEETVLRAELDLSLIRDQRLQEPALRGLRPDLYLP